MAESQSNHPHRTEGPLPGDTAPMQRTIVRKRIRKIAVTASPGPKPNKSGQPLQSATRQPVPDALPSETVEPRPRRSSLSQEERTAAARERIRARRRRRRRRIPSGAVAAVLAVLVVAIALVITLLPRGANHEDAQTEKASEAMDATDSSATPTKDDTQDDAKAGGASSEDTEDDGPADAEADKSQEGTGEPDVGTAADTVQGTAPTDGAAAESAGTDAGSGTSGKVSQTDSGNSTQTGGSEGNEAGGSGTGSGGNTATGDSGTGSGGSGKTSHGTPESTTPNAADSSSQDSSSSAEADTWVQGEACATDVAESGTVTASEIPLDDSVPQVGLDTRSNPYRHLGAYVEVRYGDVIVRAQVVDYGNYNGGTTGIMINPAVFRQFGASSVDSWGRRQVSYRFL